MILICNTCKTRRRMVYKRYHLGIREMWECKCGCRPIKDLNWDRKIGGKP